MRPVSEYYKQKIASGETRNFHIKVMMTLADGTQYDDVHNPAITEADIMDSSFKILTASSGQSSFDIGAAIIGKCQFTLKNFEDEWAGVDFFNAEATVWIGLDGDETNGTQIYHRVGFFTVDEPQYAGSMVSLELLDNMWKFDKDLPSIPLPQTIGQIVNRLCTHCGVGLGTQTFNGSTYQITELPDTDMNCRELLQYLAMIGCNFCQINDNGSLDVKWYDVLSRPEADLDGGSFSTNTTPYSDGDSADGGNFTNYDSGDNYDGGVFAENTDIAYFTRLFTRTVGTDEITITGVKIKIGDTDYLRGNEGYVIVLDNPLVTESNVTTILNMIWNRLRGFTFRTYTLTALPDLAPEVGDCVAISYKGNMVYSYLTNYTFTPSLVTASLGAVTPSRTLSQRYSKAVQSAVEVARKNVKQQIGIYDLSAQRMNQLAINAMGGYTDYDDLPTGGRVYYLSNAPITKNATTGMCQFPDSAIVYKTTGEGFFVSTSGSVDPQTHERIWTQGYTPSTGLLVELLTALRINAEQMYTGVLEVGGSQIGVTKPYIRVLDVNDDPVCTINHEGITMHQGLIQSPDYEEETPVGTFSDTGMMIDVLNSILKSPFFALNNNGAYLKGEIQATSGKIGAADITPYSIIIRGDIELYNGTGTSFDFAPYNYRLSENFNLTFYNETESMTVTIQQYTHGSSSPTTVETLSVPADTPTTSLTSLDHLVGQTDGDYYHVSSTATSTWSAMIDDAILAYMGEGGFRGFMKGIFEGYIESESGKLGNFTYSRAEHGINAEQELDIDVKDGNNEGELNIDPNRMIYKSRYDEDITIGGHDSTANKPTITRTDSNDVTSHVIWSDTLLDDMENRLFPQGKEITVTRPTGSNYLYINFDPLKYDSANDPYEQTPSLPLADGAICLIYE